VFGLIGELIRNFLPVIKVFENQLWCLEFLLVPSFEQIPPPEKSTKSRS
jgi:hypothetical protein